MDGSFNRDISAISGLKWHEVAPYWVKTGDNDHVIGHMLINDKSWKALPGDLKKGLKQWDVLFS
jgi:TRAP-type C4-dicarboxylate transport system substrate-binding protein